MTYCIITIRHSIMPLTATKDGPCNICEGIIQAGEISRPMINNNNEKNGLLWAHLSCIDKDDQRIPICKHSTCPL